MSPPLRTYADAARNFGGHASDGNNPGPLGYSVNRKNSGASNEAPHRGSVVTIEEPVRTSHDLTRPRHAVSPPTSRRPSIAQVIGRTLSRSSHVSEVASGPSTSFNLEVVPEQDDILQPRPSKKRKRAKPRNRRRRSSSKTRDHGDFTAFHAQATNIRASNVPQKTPLLIAISDRNITHVEQLLSNESNIDGASSNPLQTAAEEGDEAIVKLLLESGHFNIDARDSRERTAVYAATSRGHESIVKLLLKHNAKPLSPEESRIANQELAKWRLYESQIKKHDSTSSQREQTIEGAEMTEEPEDTSREDFNASQSPHPATHRSESHDVDRLYRLIEGSAANVKEMEEAVNVERRAAQQRGEWVGPPLSPSLLKPAEKEIGTQQKHVRFPGFGFEIPVVEFDFSLGGGHRIVSPTPLVDELLYGVRGVDTIAKGSGPASLATCRWYHLPANHLGWTEDLIRRIYERRSPEEQKKREVILNREPFKIVDQDHTSAVSLDPRPQSRALRPLCRNMTISRDGTQRLSSAFALIVPFVHWETEANMAEMTRVMDTVRIGRKNDIDNPEPSQRSIPDIKVIQGHSSWSKNEKLLCAYLYNQPPVHPRRTLDQFYYHMLEDTKERDKDQVITRYYHNVWKRNDRAPHDEDEYNFAMSAPQKPEFSFQLNNVINEDLPLGHQDMFPESHDRDDFLPPTADSGLSISVSKTRSETIEPKEPRHVMMVDQLWLWILDENTIITSFPRNWSRDDGSPITNEDSRDVLDSIHKFFTLVNRPPLESVYDLAQLIVYKCLETFCKKSTPYGQMQILDVYECAIASVTDRETKVFNEFATKSKMKRSQQQESKSPDNLEEMYNIDIEVELLKEIKDIQDELHILMVLLENQNTVLQQATEEMGKRANFQDLASKAQRSPGGTTSKPGQEAPYRETFNFGRLHQLIIDQEKRRKTLQVQAEQANKALNHLLDLKQKQANVSEARSARWTAESAKQQGNIMVLFTLVTIIFAPLSLIATIFSLRIVEFPPDLHLHYVFQFMFGISVAIIFPMIALVIYTTRRSITKVIRRLENRIKLRKWFHNIRWQRKRKMWRRQWEEKEGDYASSSGTTDDKERAKKQTAFWRKGFGKDVMDIEKGVTYGKTLD